MAATGPDMLECPFCGHSAVEYGMLVHMTEAHPEDGSAPSAARGGDLRHDNAPMEEPWPQYVECPLDDCDEVLLMEEMESHLEIHRQCDIADDVDDSSHDASETASASTAITVPSPSEQPARAQRSSKRGEGSRRSDKAREKESKSKKNALAISRWAAIFKPRLHTKGKKRKHRSSSDREGKSKGDELMVDVESSALSLKYQRLGKKELGRFHDEKRMPSWLVAHLTKNWGNKQPGIIPVLAQFLAYSPETKYAYLCDPRTQHVTKLNGEGSFCGYRNIQTVSSYIIGAGYPGHEGFKGRLPSVFDIQELIESAWDRGINTSGRVETGGIRMTRKYIGTPEAQAMFTGMGIPCEATGFKDPAMGNAETRLMRDVENYYSQGIFDPALKVRCTTLPPIYFQHPGHSLTIIGIQRTVDDELNLLVFDPVFRDSHAIIRHVGDAFKPRFPDTMLKPYRRGHRYLRQWNEFELLKLPPRDQDLLP